MKVPDIAAERVAAQGLNQGKARDQAGHAEQADGDPDNAWTPALFGFIEVRRA